MTAHHEEREPLVPPDEPCGDAPALAFDESGAVAEARDDPVRAPQPFPRPPLFRACTLRGLSGSWLLELRRAGPAPLPLRAVRGPMRIEATSALLRISGDVYVREPVIGPIREPRLPLESDSPIPPGMLFAGNWYPAFPQSEYRWYFRSTGGTYVDGELKFNLERHLWGSAQQEFIQTDTGSMTLRCAQRIVAPPWAPQPTVQMSGTARIGGTSYDVTATKTSPLFRGCLVEVDVMTGRSWPASAASCDGQLTHTFFNVYRGAGMDFRATVNEIDVPEDELLTTAELHQLLASHRSLSPGAANWRLWLLVGTRSDEQRGLFGVMFDSDNPPHREGAVGFADSPLSPGIAEPVDALGLRAAADEADGLRLSLELPAQAHRGEFVSATVTVTNTADEPRHVTAALNLSEGDLWLLIDSPTGDRAEVRDVVLACGERRFVALAPGESLTGQLELFYTNRGFTLDHAGTYTLRAELDVGWPAGTLVHSDPVQIAVRPATSEDERELEQLTVDAGVGLAFGLGDFGADRDAHERLTAVMNRFPGTETAAASAMVVANSAGRDFRDLRAGEVVRPADQELASRAFDAATADRDAADVARLAAAVVSPVAPRPSVLERVQDLIAGETDYDEEDVSHANAILEAHRPEIGYLRPCSRASRARSALSASSSGAISSTRAPNGKSTRWESPFVTSRNSPPASPASGRPIVEGSKASASRSSTAASAAQSSPPSGTSTRMSGGCAPGTLPVSE